MTTFGPPCERKNLAGRLTASLKEQKTLSVFILTHL